MAHKVIFIKPTAAVATESNENLNVSGILKI
jgi:hypothetical protein